MTTGLVAGMWAALWLTVDPFVLLGPATLTAAERRALERGDMVSRTYDGVAGQVGVFAISRINAGPDALMASARSIEELKRSTFVMGIKRFSDPPRIEDLDSLVLPPKELQAAAACRRGSCSMKLTSAEIDRLTAESSLKSDDQSDRVLRAFRRIVLARVTSYLSSGAPDLAAVVNRPGAPRTESFLYWSLESYGSGKPVVLVTHVNIVPPGEPGDAAIVIGKQLFANHYINDALAITAIVTDTTGAPFLMYRNHTSLDLLGGMLGPIRRAVIESRLRRDVPGIIQKLRVRLEKQGPALRPAP